MLLVELGERPGTVEPDLRALVELLRSACADVEVGVRAGLALLRLSLSFLAGAQSSPWIATLSEPAVEASQAWARCPCPAHAKRAWITASQVEAQADRADAATTHVGDWWSYQAVQTAHFLPAAIALSAGLPEPVPADPLGPDPTALLVSVCEEFMVLPSHVTRTYDQARAALLDQLVPWLLGHADPLASSPPQRPLQGGLT